MARIEIDGIYKHAPLTDAQLNSVTRRNLDREIVIKRDAVTDRATLIPNVTTPSTDAGAYPTNYIYAMNYDTTDDGGVNPNIRRHIPTLEFLGNSAVDTAGSNWINVESRAYNYVTSGATLQTAVQELDSLLASNTLKYIIDGSTTGSLVSSTDGNTPVSINSGGTYQIALGLNNYINSSALSSILGGQLNYISAGTSDVVGGLNNRITNTGNYSVIGGGIGNLISGYDGSSFSLQFSVASLTQSGGTATLVTYARHGLGIGLTLAASVINVNESEYAISATMTVVDEYTLTYPIDPSAPTPATPTTTIESYGIQFLINSGAGGSFSFIGSGVNNYIISTSSSAIAGGNRNNIVYSSNCFIGGGQVNNISNSSQYSGILGGYNNYIIDNSTYGSISGGYGNYIGQSADYCSIAGGENNHITSTISHAFIGAGFDNYVIEESNYASVVSGYQNRIRAGSLSSFIGGGNLNWISSSVWGSITGGYVNYITDGSNYSSISGGANNYIGQSGTYCSIVGGNNNYITSGSPYNIIGNGRDNNIIEGASYSAIVNGYINYIKDASSYCFIGGGSNNIIKQASSYSAILGGINNILGATSMLESSFIIGSNIDVSASTSYQYDNTTYMNNITLWDRGVVLKDRTGNQGDVLIIESIGTNGVPIVTWGSVSNSGSYSGTDPIPGSTGSYTTSSKGSSILLSTYITVHSAEDTVGNDDSMVGTTFDPTGYNFTNSDASTYATIMTDMIGTSSPGLVIEDGYRYQIDVDLITITWGGYLSGNRPRLTLSYIPAIIFSTTDYTFGPNIGTIAGNVIISDATNANYQFTTSDSSAPTTLGPYLMLAYNSTEKKINFILKDIYASSRYVYKMPATYNSLSGGSTMDITWNSSLYPLPTTSDVVAFWNSDPATNGGNPNLTISSVVGNLVTINTNYGVQVDKPCWVHVKGRMPVVSVKINYTVTKTAI